MICPGPSQRALSACIHEVAHTGSSPAPQETRSGAQIISTDYYRPDPRAEKESGWTNYVVKVPGGGAARVNPVSGPEKMRWEKVGE